MKPPRTEVIRCPVHRIPDCSPLLNGCTLPTRLVAAYAAGYRAAVHDASNRTVEALHELYDEPEAPIQTMPQSYVVNRTCRCKMTRLNREKSSCPECRDHIDLPVIAER